MRKIALHRSGLHAHVGCFGNFRIDDSICRKLCAIRIRCAIERDQKAFLEVLEEMEGPEDFLLKFGR
jgi:hypothetical protein